MKTVFGSVSRPLRPILLSAEAALWGGFAILLVLTAFLTWDTLRSAERIELTNASIHSASREGDRIMDRLRVDLQLSSTLLRDALLEAGSPLAEERRRELADVRHRLETDLGQYVTGLPGQEREPFERLRKSIQDYWGVMAPVLQQREKERPEQARQFLEKEVLPRRRLVLEMARQLTDWNERQADADEERVQKVYRGFRWRVLLVGGTMLAMGLLVAGFSIYRIRYLEGEAARRYQEVVQARLQLQELSAQLVSAQEEERRRLSRELHDEVGQSLSAVLVELGNLTSALPQDAVLLGRADRVRQLAEDSVGVVRNMSLLLRPSMLDDLGLVPALQWHAREVARRHGVKVRVAADAVEDELPDEHRTCAYRVVQEALQNVVRHAQATSARVTLRLDADKLAVMVQDDGKGFDAKREKGVGLLGMEERVKRLGGSLRIDSEPGTGTLVTALLPLSTGASKA